MEIVTSDVENLIQNKINSAEKKYGKEFKNILLEIVSLEKMIMLALDKEASAAKPDVFIPISDWNKYHKYPTVKGMRQLDYKKEKNGFEEFNVTTRSEGRVLVNEKNYFLWRASRSK